jgi:hypothetical protein
MKKTIIFLMICTIGFSSLRGYSQSLDADSLKSSGIKKPEIDRIFDDGHFPMFYMINVKAFGDADSAVAKVKEMRTTHKDVNYLWLPDYESLNNKPLYVVFLGPYKYIDSCLLALSEYKKLDSTAYAILAEHSKKRTVLYSWSNISINGIQQSLIFAYANPKEEEEYLNSGGGDWFNSMEDVRMYFLKAYPNSVFDGYLCKSGLTEIEIHELEKEMGLSGFGFLLVKGNKKKFIAGYSPQTMVIEEACKFFGLEIKPFDIIWQE